MGPSPSEEQSIHLPVSAQNSRNTCPTCQIALAASATRDHEHVALELSGVVGDVEHTSEGPRMC